MAIIVLLLHEMHGMLRLTYVWSQSVTTAKYIAVKYVIRIPMYSIFW